MSPILWGVAMVLMTAGLGGAEPGQQLADQVRAAETAFARTMADRDLDAFGSFLADEAVFFGSAEVHRGKEAILAAWTPFFTAVQAPFSWQPETVEVLESGRLALSSGPVLDPAGNPIGTFNSVWRLETPGVWKVVFDKGCPHCQE